MATFLRSIGRRVGPEGTVLFWTSSSSKRSVLEIDGVRSHDVGSFVSLHTPTSLVETTKSIVFLIYSLPLYRHVLKTKLWGRPRRHYPHPLSFRVLYSVHYEGEFNPPVSSLPTLISFSITSSETTLRVPPVSCPHLYLAEGGMENEWITGTWMSSKHRNTFWSCAGIKE